MMLYNIYKQLIIDILLKDIHHKSKHDIDMLILYDYLYTHREKVTFKKTRDRK